ncbi:hypothetical protein [Nocardia alni]|uniref:hypothetical protein n=1 Tax=Nocardia alni TaxID=2815723 RepID=UPI001C23C294|nr:hypothetical protein [Nocardia alni]
MLGDSVFQDAVVGQQRVPAIDEPLDRAAHPSSQATVGGSGFPGAVQRPARLHPTR